MLFWLFPNFKPEPIIGVDYTHGKLDKAENDSSETDESVWREIGFSVVDDDIIVEHHVDADDNRHEGWDFERVVHVLLSYLLHLQQTVRRFNFCLNRTGIPQQWHDFVTVSRALHFLHDCIAKITWKTVENRVFGENNGLGCSSIHNLNLQKTFFEEFEHGQVFWSEFVVHGVNSTAFSQFFLHVIEDNDDVDDSHHIIVENALLHFVDILNHIFFVI